MCGLGGRVWWRCECFNHPHGSDQWGSALSFSIMHWLRSCWHHFSAIWPSVNDLTSLSLCFFPGLLRGLNELMHKTQCVEEHLTHSKNSPSINHITFWLFQHKNYFWLSEWRLLSIPHGVEMVPCPLLNALTHGSFVLASRIWGRGSNHVRL